MVENPLGLGIIGAGAAVRKLHWPVLKEMQREVRIQGVANRNRTTAERFALDVAARVYDTHQALLESPDVQAVLIAVPIVDTAAIVIDAIQSGKHVMVEKPLAASSEEALHIVKEAGKGRQQVAVAENFRYREDILKAKQVIRSGGIGRVISFQVVTKFDRNAAIRRDWFERPWRKSPLHPGGILLDAGVHAVAGLREVLGEVFSLFSQISDYDNETNEPSVLLMQLTMDSGCIGHYYACYSARVRPETIFDLSVIGDRGSLDLKEGHVSWFNEQGSAEERFAEFDRGYQRQWQDFLAAVRGEGALQSTVEKAYGDLIVLEAGFRSSQSGQVERIIDACLVNCGRPSDSL
jgi:predicted dehydrogenase